MYLFPIFRVNIAKDMGEVPSTSASTSESYCVQVPIATCEHDYVVLHESDLSKLESAQAELQRLEEEKTALTEALFGLELIHNDDNTIIF